MIKFSPVLEVYITHVCNLSCRECNRFNNYNFKGHLYWDDYTSDFENWSKRITANRITIIGGEPTLNPDLEKWMSNLRRLWPDVEIMVQTNGTYLRPEFIDLTNKYNIGFTVSLHDVSTAKAIMDNWTKNYHSEFGNFVQGFIFSQSNIIDKGTHFTVYNEEPKLSFDACGMKYDHTLFRGKLYKCPSMALFPEFKNQFNLQLTDEQLKLLKLYQPLDSTCSEEELLEFANTRESPLPQCQFCANNLRFLSANGPKNENITKPNLNDELPNYSYITYENLEFYKNLLL